MMSAADNGKHRSGDLGPRVGMADTDRAAVVERILSTATMAEKVAMMSGRGFVASFRASGGRLGADPYQAGGGCDRLGVPAFWFTDGTRGVARGRSTCFPVSMARGASFDPDLERRIGEAMAIEARAQGCNLSGAVCINLLRHPAWGRSQETYGEDPHHLGEMGAALTEGLQAHNVVASVKHYALNSMENARFTVDVAVDERALHEVYLPHFKRVIDAGCASVMSAYNKVDGEYCGQHRVLLTDILRDEWGFDGFVHSDWMVGVYKPYAVEAGLDVEMPEPIVFGDRLRALVEAGTIDPGLIDRACRRILTTLYRFAAAEDPLEVYDAALVASPAHVALAREAATKGAVLLKNDGALPIRPADVASIAVFGRLADAANTGDHGSSRVDPPYVVTPLAGLRARYGDIVTVGGDESDAAAAADAAANAGAAIVVVGYTAADEGEFIPGDITLDQITGAAPMPDADTIRSKPSQGGDRRSLRLPADQAALIRAVAAANPRTIVVIVAGAAVIPIEWIGVVSGVIQSFYAGMEGGTALATLISGDVSPSGKLPFTVAADEDDYPTFDPDAIHVAYDRYHGYTLLERNGRTPLFAFGHGLSYAAFDYRALRLRATAETLFATVTVANVGDVVADEIVQAYVGFPGSEVDRPRKLLRGFRRITLAPGERRIVQFAIPRADLRWRSPDTHDWRFEHGEHTVFVGGSSQLADRLAATIAL